MYPNLAAKFYAHPAQNETIVPDSNDFTEDYQRLKNAGVPVVTEPHFP